MKTTKEEREKKITIYAVVGVETIGRCEEFGGLTVDSIHLTEADAKKRIWNITHKEGDGFWGYYDSHYNEWEVEDFSVPRSFFENALKKEDLFW